MNETDLKTDAKGNPEAAAAHGKPHVTSVKLLLGVWAALVVLTVITVAVTYVDFGSLNLVVALGIATLKATLVALYFMHLRWDRGLNAVVFLTAIVFVALFVLLAMMDTLEYKGQKIPDHAPGVVERE